MTALGHSDAIAADGQSRSSVREHSFVVRGHMPALDGLRGLAIAMVLMLHFVGDTLPSNGIETIVVGIANYGSYGVDLFFVLSGFLITGILYDTRDDRHYFRNFFVRRVLRIFPLYYGVLILVFFVAPLLPLFQGPTLDGLIDRQSWAWLYGINVYIALQGEWSFSYLQHFWSLCVEEHFYLVWPLIVYLLASRPRHLVMVALAIAVGAMLARLTGSALGLSWWTTYVLTPFRLDGLALGGFLAVAARQPGGKEWILRLTPWIVLIAGLSLMATFTWTRLISRDDMAIVLPIRAALCQILLGCLLVGALAAPRSSMVSRFFCSRAMAFLGTYSYGLYVYHHFISYYLSTHRTELVLAERLGSHPAAVILQASVGIAVSVLIAYLSYEMFEKRLLVLKQYFAAGH